MTKPFSSNQAALIAGCAAVLLSSYFLLPMAYQIALQRAVDRGLISGSAMESFFIPMRETMQRVPAYKAWVESQFHFCIEHGLM